MARELTYVRIVDAALHEAGNGDITIRGVIAPESLHLLKTDDYQREVRPQSSRGSIINAIRHGDTLPSVELGMRGQKFDDKGGTFVLKDPTYIIDGLQRVSSALYVRDTDADIPISLGCQVRFQTDEASERELFRKLNTLRSKVSPNILLRNMRADNVTIASIYGLTTNDKTFALHNRVSWRQNMARGELVTALMVCKVVSFLHRHHGGGNRNQVDDIAASLDRMSKKVGLQTVRDNLKHFFELVDECWGVKCVQYREGAIYMRGTFLFALACVLSDHRDFWTGPEDKKLFIPSGLRRKISQFQVHDPEIGRLAGSAGKSKEILYFLMRDHINSGKRTKRLTARVVHEEPEVEEEEVVA